MDVENKVVGERINAGLNRARAEGKRLGRKPGLVKKTRTKRAAILRLRAEGVSLRKIAAEVELAKGTVMKVLSENS